MQSDFWNGMVLRVTPGGVAGKRGKPERARFLQRACAGFSE